MASISSLSSSSSSSTSSIFGNSNVISGLASGMDTESMIENAVSGIKEKIKSLNKDRTMLEWEQSAYQSMIDKLSSFADKYTPYYTYSSSSSTNLLTEAFFNKSTTVTSTGTYKDLVSAVGNTDSDIKILSATMATKAEFKGTSIKDDNGDYVDGSTTLRDLKFSDSSTWTKGDAVKDSDGNELKDESGNTIYEMSTTFKITLGEGDDAKEYTVEINDSMTMDEVAGAITNAKRKYTDEKGNEQEETISGLKASYSSTSGKFLISSKETGKDQSFTISGIGSSDIVKNLFGNETVSAAGTNAEVMMDVNGEKITKSLDKNQIEVDGLTINIQGEFTVDETKGESAVSFTSKMDTDKIVDVIKTMVEEFNTMANEVKDAYSTQPLKDSNKKRYEPLVEEEAEDMSETAIEKYEAKAKTGILFGDSTLSALYDKLREAANALGSSGIGITTEYKDGKTTLVLDEDKLRSTLEADPDKVIDVFTSEEKSDKYNSKGWGAMTSLKNTLYEYANTSGSLSSQGHLVKLAGSEKSTQSLENNTYKTRLASLDETIERWQEKLSNKIDYYQTQFTNLEKLISQMNSQSSTLSGLTGY